MADFSVGDVVVLKSGGPKMTVVEKNSGTGNGLVLRCAWFEPSLQGMPLAENFPVNTVEVPAKLEW